jgi:hypothetical protein
MNYTFPFSTCERANTSGLAQPYSVFVNVLSLFVIVYFLCQTKNVYSFLLILSLLVFEFVHTFSHAIHIPSHLQVNIIHSTAYVINLFYLLTLSNYTHHAPSLLFGAYLFLLLLFDIYSFAFLSMVFYLTSSIMIFISILLYYLQYLPKNLQHYIYTIVALGIAILLLFYNETVNCSAMLAFMPSFPFHAILESVGLVTFYFIGKFFSSL